MRKTVTVLAILLFGALLNADVVMKLSMPRERYMTYEPVIANLALRNTSGQGLIFGHEAEFKGFLEIGLFDMHDRPLKGSGTKVDLKGLILRPGADHHIRVNIGKWLDMRRAGFYKLKLFISHPMLKNEYESNFCTFDITNGQIFWQRNFGIPNLQGAQLGEDLKIRSYVIKTLQDKSNICFYLFVEDKNKVYAVRHLGVLLGRELPSFELDSLNQLHMLLPISSKKFNYAIFDWHGNQEKQSYYRISRTVPTLFRQGTTGDVSVVGGELILPGEGYAQEKLLPNLPADAINTPPAAQKQPAPANKK